MKTLWKSNLVRSCTHKYAAATTAVKDDYCMSLNSHERAIKKEGRTDRQKCKVLTTQGYPVGIYLPSPGECDIRAIDTQREVYWNQSLFNLSTNI